MAEEFKLKWDQTGEKLYETGVDRGVLYPQVSGAYPKGVAWNGLTGVTESPSGAEASPFYADNSKYLNLMSAEDMGVTITAYMYPDEFGECNGEKEVAPGVVVGQQTHKPFGMCYRTIIGNDTESNDYGYKLHLLYGAQTSPAERAYATVNDSPEPIEFSWEAATTPVEVPGCKKTALLTIDSTKVDSVKLASLEAILYGSGETEARLPLPKEVAELFKAAASDPAGQEVAAG